jgi:guanylate kinase
MNIISFSGPRGAGKGTIIDALLVRLEKEFPGMVSRAITITDREIRPGEVEGKNIITCSKEEFQNLENQGKILFPKVIPNSLTGIDYKNGVFPSELTKSKVVLLDMHGASVNLLKEYLALNNGEIKSVFVYTKPECRKIRIAGREG